MMYGCMIKAHLAAFTRFILARLMRTTFDIVSQRELVFMRQACVLQAFPKHMRSFSLFLPTGLLFSPPYTAISMVGCFSW